MPADTSKVTAGHLRRAAYLYIRQSTMYQVIHNTESTRRQYDLKGRAVALGWDAAQVHVIDVDQGQSGASAADRAGFQQLVGEVSLGRAGIVLGLECSRLARDNADWQALIKMCALNGTLICDEDGLYDPAGVNDRLLLGLKGQISEFELHYLQARMRGGLLAKAARGELAVRLPAAFCYDAAGTVTLDPDAGVRKAIACLFDTFAQTGSATAVVKAFTAGGLKFPARDATGEHAGQLRWKPLRHDQVLFVLHNPRYAGACFYGRRAHHSIGGKTGTSSKPRQEWTTLIPGAHDGYITWAQYEANQATLAANAAARGGDRKAGPPREGPALLQGLVICGKCGKRMTVSYHARCDATLVPDYACQREGIAAGAPPCQRFCGSGIDAAVAALVLDALTPLAIEAALEVTAQLHARAAEADAIRATRAARPARRRYRTGPLPGRRPRQPAGRRRPRSRLEPPAPRPVRRPGRLRPGQPRRRRHAHRRPARADPGTGRRPARPVAQPRHQHARPQAPDPAAGHRRHPDQEQRAHHCPGPAIGGQDHTLTIDRPRTAWEQHTTPAATIALIGQLAGDHPFDEIAPILSQHGITSGWGRPCTVQSLAAICKDRGIPAYADRLRARGMLTLQQAAAEFGVTTATVMRWRRDGLITGHRADGRGTCLFPPGQQRPASFHARAATHRAKAGLLSARQLGARLGAHPSTIFRWHQLGLIGAAGADHRGFPVFPAGQQRPTAAQVTAAGRPAAHRDQELITGGQLAARLGVTRSAIYTWHRLGLIDTVTADYRGRNLYRPGQQAPAAADIAAARAARAASRPVPPAATAGPQR